jgi:hypothetical protein
MDLQSPEDFETTKELMEYVRSLIVQCTSLKKYRPAVYVFFYKLFQRHPEKERKRTTEIVDIAIEPHKKKGLVIRIVFNDGTSDTISYVACVKQKGSSFTKKLSQAYRAAISDQIESFIRENHGPCEFCGSTKDRTVDHINHFAELVYEFKKMNLTEPTSLDKNDAQQHCFKEEDVDYKNKWAEYHKKHATLRILCNTCNIKREKWKKPLEDISSQCHTER